jgi:hypothetical protein
VAGARDGWEGVYRVEFDETWRTQQARLIGLKEDLQRLSGAISGAMANVAGVNGRRATERAAYRAERDALTEAG